jgi:hypothetical protein
MRRPHAQIHLPPLAPHDALALVNTLERAIAAIWRAHGLQMADLLTARDMVEPSQPGAGRLANPIPSADDDCF